MFNMRRHLYLMVFLFIGIAFVFKGIAQTVTDNDDFDPIVDDIAKRIPAVEALIDSAIANSPYLKFRDAQIVVNQYKYQNDRSQILRNIGFSLEMRYGRFDNFSENSNIGSVPVYVATTGDDIRYGAGAYLKLPLYDLTNRRTTMNLAKKEIEQAINHRNELIHEIRKDVIVQYNELLLRQRLLRIASDNQLTSEINLKMAEKLFSSGQLPLAEMSRMMDIMAMAKSEYEQQKTSFIVAYSLLEITTGVQFNLLNKIQ